MSTNAILRDIIRKIHRRVKASHRRTLITNGISGLSIRLFTKYTTKNCVDYLRKDLAVELLLHLNILKICLYCGGCLDFDDKLDNNVRGAYTLNSSPFECCTKQFHTDSLLTISVPNRHEQLEFHSLLKLCIMVHKSQLLYYHLPNSIRNLL